MITENSDVRLLGRQLAAELTDNEIDEVAGGMEEAVVICPETKTCTRNSDCD